MDKLLRDIPYKFLQLSLSNKGIANVVRMARCNATAEFLTDKIEGMFDCREYHRHEIYGLVDDLLFLWHAI